MSGKILSAAILAAVLGATAAWSEDLAGPAEMPPPSYKGQQYVDSRGCVFLRAGYGGQVTWVPRVTRERKQLCGYPPSGGAVAVAEEATTEEKTAAVAAAPEPKAEEKAVETKVAAAADTAPAKAPKPEVVAAAPKTPAPTEVRPATPTELAATGGTQGTAAAIPDTSGYRLACPAETPVAERFALTTGGSKLLCTKGDGTLDGANFPILVEGSVDGQPTGYAAHMAATGATVAAGTTSASEAATAKSTKTAKLPLMVPPPGYKLAWSDDRLNPNRGKQTAEGFLEMDEIWTRTVPAELREDTKTKRKPVTIIVRHQDGTESKHAGYVLSSKGGKKVVQFVDPSEAVSKSTKAVEPEAAPKATKAAKAAGGSFLVQVGTFGKAANADKAASRLKGMGLPVARSKAKGGAMTVVYAGPFTSAIEAKAAMLDARSAGYSDAVIVQ